MSKKVTIPTDGGNPFVVILGGIKYVYKPGETVDVPDGVALEIEEWERWRDKYRGAVQPPFAAGGGGVQPDLSQNDPNATDYVKNRTHYVQSEQKEIIPPTSVQPIASVGWTALGDGVKLWASYFRRGGLANPQRGERYKAIVGLNELIEFNPVSAHESDEFVNGTYAGNLFLYGVYKINSKTATKAEIEAMGYVDNGESFFFGTAVDFPNPYIITTSQFYPNLTSLTRVSVEQCEVIKTLDPKYLPDSVPYEETTVVNEPLNITWDGNTEGLVSAVNMASGGVHSDYYKISDAILTDEQIKTITETDDIGYSQAVSDFWDEFLSYGFVTPEVVYACNCYYVRKAGAELRHLVFPEPGIYAWSDPGVANVASLTTTEPVEQTKTVVKKLDKKFLPDDIGSGSIMYCGGNNDDDDVHLFHFNFDTGEIGAAVTREELVAAIKHGAIYIALIDKYSVQYKLATLVYFGDDDGYIGTSDEEYFHTAEFEQSSGPV